jgi:hypothetical protein
MRPMAGKGGNRSRAGSHWSVWSTRAGGGPQSPPPGVDLSKKGGLAGLRAAGTHRREGDRGSTLPDVPIHPGRLGGVVTPFVPTVTPMLPMGSNGGRHLLLSINEEGVKLCLRRKREQPGPPMGGKGLGTNQRFKDQIKAMGRTPEAQPRLSSLRRFPLRKSLSRAAETASPAGVGLADSRLRSTEPLRAARGTNSPD